MHYEKTPLIKQQDYGFLAPERPHPELSTSFKSRIYNFVKEEIIQHGILRKKYHTRVH